MSRCGCVGKPTAGRDPVLVDHSQTPEPHVAGVVVVREGERVVAVEPAVLSVSAFVRLTYLNHDSMLRAKSERR